jgi:hypothetical protein
MVAVRSGAPSISPPGFAELDDAGEAIAGKDLTLGGGEHAFRRFKPFADPGHSANRDSGSSAMAGAILWRWAAQTGRFRACVQP